MLCLLCCVALAMLAGCGRFDFDEVRSDADGYVTLTESLSQDIVDGNSVNCNMNGVQGDNSYYRVFDLPQLGVDGALDIRNIDFGVEFATAPGGQQTVTVALYTLTGTFTRANLHPIGSTQTQVADQKDAMVSAPVDATAPAGSELVVEIHPPVDSGNLLIGSNPRGQTGASFIRSPNAGCNINEPTDLASIGKAGMHIVLDVGGFVHS
jgi:hypothetical protein